MATIKSYTDLSQSKKLAEILPLESADMSWIIVNYGDEAGSRHEPSLTTYKTGSFFRDRIFPKDHTIPCWSLAALLGVLPVIIGDVLSDNALRLRIDKSETDFDVWYENLDSGMVEEGLDIIKTNPVDACYEMILKLHELNLL